MGKMSNISLGIWLQNQKQPPSRGLLGRGGRQALLQDPAGNLVELFQAPD
jgi:hypothetical protein